MHYTLNSCSHCKKFYMHSSGGTIEILAFWQIQFVELCYRMNSMQPVGEWRIQIHHDEEFFHVLVLHELPALMPLCVINFGNSFFHTRNDCSNFYYDYSIYCHIFGWNSMRRWHISYKNNAKWANQQQRLKIFSTILTKYCTETN